MDPVHAATSVHEHLSVHLVPASVDSVHASRAPESPTSSSLHLPLPLHHFLTPLPTLLQHRQHRQVTDSDDDDDDNGRANGAVTAATTAAVPTCPRQPPTPPLPPAGLGRSPSPETAAAAIEAATLAVATIEAAGAAAAAAAAAAGAAATRRWRRTTGRRHARRTTGGGARGRGRSWSSRREAPERAKERVEEDAVDEEDYGRRSSRR